MLGIGTDLISVDRIHRAAERTGGRFLRRVFTTAERRYCQAKAQEYNLFAARFAAKEAVLKALGTGLSQCSWQDVEIISAVTGQPEVRLYGGAAMVAGKLGVDRVLISLSHECGRAVAFAVAVGSPAVKGVKGCGY